MAATLPQNIDGSPQRSVAQAKVRAETALAGWRAPFREAALGAGALHSSLTSAMDLGSEKGLPCVAGVSMLMGSACVGTNPLHSGN